MEDDVHVIAHKNVRVLDEAGQVVALFPEEVTRPALSKSLTLTDLDDQTFEVRLKDKSTKRLLHKRPQPLEDMNELSEMQKYTKKGGLRFSLHRWPKLFRKKRNIFRQPWKMDEEAIYDYTGMTAKNFWRMVQDLSKTKIDESLTHGNLSLPSAVLLLR